MLKTVRIPSSARVGPAWRMAGWKAGAKRKAMPTRSRHRSACSAVTAIFTPKASSTSALPHWLVALRLPCLATVTPAAAATMADPVEMLNVFEKSPPVPQVSMASGGAATATAAARMARAKPRSRRRSRPSCAVR